MMVGLIILEWIASLGVTEGFALTTRTKDLQFDDRDLKIRLWTDETRSFFKVGDPVNLLFQANQDCYVTVFAVGTSGRIAVIFPNRWHRSNRVQGGKVYGVVPQSSDTVLRVRGPAGTERVRAIASTLPCSMSPQSAEDLEAVLRDLQRQDSPGGFRVLTDAEVRIQVVDGQGVGTQLPAEDNIPQGTVARPMGRVPTRQGPPSPFRQEMVGSESAREPILADEPSQPRGQTRFPFRAEPVHEEPPPSNDLSEKRQNLTLTGTRPVLPFSRVEALPDEDRLVIGPAPSLTEKPFTKPFPFTRIPVEASEIYDENSGSTDAKSPRARRDQFLPPE